MDSFHIRKVEKGFALFPSHSDSPAELERDGEKYIANELDLVGLAQALCDVYASFPVPTGNNTRGWRERFGVSLQIDRDCAEAYPLVILCEQMNKAYETIDSLAMRVETQRRSMDSAIDRLK